MILGSSLILWSPRSPDEVASALEAHPQFAGSADSEGFNLSFAIPNRKNSWRPSLEGTLRPGAEGTLIEVNFKMNLFVLLFTFVHGIPFMGITWLMGWGGFAWGRKAGSTLLRETTEAVFEGEEALARAAESKAGDPTAAGADSSAPWSFRAKSDMNSARFELRETLRGTPTLVEVSGQGVQIRLRDQQRRLAWNEVDFVLVGPTAEGFQLQIQLHDASTVQIAIGGHNLEDQDWFVEYLNARNAQYSASEEDRRQLTEDRAKLASMRQKN